MPAPRRKRQPRGAARQGAAGLAGQAPPNRRRPANQGVSQGTARDRPRRQPRGRGRRQQEPNRPKRNPYQGALYDPTAPLAGRDLGRAANRLVNLEFGARRRAITRADQQARAQGSALIDRAGSYYQDAAGQLAGDTTRQQAIGQLLQQQLQGISSQTQTALQGIGREADVRAAQDESVRGPGLEGGGGEQLAQEIAAQRGMAAQAAQTAQQGAAGGTADYANLMNLMSGATAARGGEVRQQLVNRVANQRAELRGQRLDLDREASGRRSEQLLNLRQSGLENLIAMRGLDIKAADLRADIQGARADQRLANRRLRLTDRQNRRQQRTTRRGQNVTARGQDLSAQTQRRGQDLSAQQRAADRRSREQIAAGRKKSTRAESTDSRKQRIGIANALEDLGAGRERRVRRNAPPLVYRAAKQLNASGFLGPETIRRLRAAGVRIPRSWLPPGGKSKIPHNKV